PARMRPVVAEAPRQVSQPLAAPQASVQAAASQPAPQPAEQHHYVAPPPVESLVATRLAPAQPAAPQPRRAPNLFSRVTGNAASWARHAVSEPTITPQMRASAPARPAPQAAAPQPPAPVLQTPPAPPQMAQQPVVHQPAPP